MFIPTVVNIGNMKLNNADHLAAVSFGRTVNVNRNVAAKKTQGFGQQLADGVLRISTVQMVLDDDVADVFSWKTNLSSHDR